jgi:hypothetical protein
VERADKVAVAVAPFRLGAARQARDRKLALRKNTPTNLLSAAEKSGRGNRSFKKDVLNAKAISALGRNTAQLSDIFSFQKRIMK